MVDFTPSPPNPLSHKGRGGFKTAAIGLVLALLLILAFAVRLHALGAQSLWNDEGNTYVQITRSFADIADHAARDIHPPGYYWLLKIWTTFTGTSEFGLRSLSVFASVLGIGFIMAAGLRLYGPVAALAAGLFAALNTFNIYYAQEARMYALLGLWSAASLWALARWLVPHPQPPLNLPRQRGRLNQRARNRSLPLLAGEGPGMGVLFALFNAAGLWTHYAYPFVMLAQGVIVLVWWLPRRDIRRLLAYIAANLLTIALYLPWLPVALERVTGWPSTGQPVPLPGALGTITGWLTLGITYTVSDSSWVAVALLLLVFGLRLRRRLWAMLLPAVWTLLPVILFLALGLFREANLKFLIVAQASAALWMGRGVWVLWTLDTGGRDQLVRLAPRLAVVLAVIGLAVNLAGGLHPLYTSAAYQRDDYRAIVRDIDGGPGDAIILNAPNQEEVFRYYYSGDAPVYPLPAGLGGDDDATRAAVTDIITRYDRVFVVLWGEAERDPNRIVETMLDQNAYEAASDWYGDVRLARYVTPAEMTITGTPEARFGDHITLQAYALSADTVQPGDVLQLRLDWRTDARLDTRYKVTVQLLDAVGRLVAQRDSEPGGGLALTTTWEPGETITDNHALIIPNNLAPANYRLIIGLYDINNSDNRLLVNRAESLTLADIAVGG